MNPLASLNTHFTVVLLGYLCYFSALTLSRRDAAPRSLNSKPCNIMLTKCLIIQEIKSTTVRILIQWHNSIVWSDKGRKIMGFSKAHILVIFVTSNKLADKQNVIQDNGSRQWKSSILSTQRPSCWCSVFPSSPSIRVPSPWSFWH